MPLRLDNLVDVHAAIDLNAVVTTPENIRFEYRIAGPFRRLPALILDFLIRCAIIFAAFIIMILVGFSIRISSGMIGLAFLILLFVLDWFYGLFFETYWNGQTPGKWLTQIRVLSVDGRPINAYQATVRNFLRLADFAPMLSLELFSPDAPPMYMFPTFLVSLICMVLTSRFQRLGDLAAGTMVVVNERSWVPTNVKLEDPRIVSLSEYIPANFRMSATLAKAIALYAERRNRIPHARRIELAGHLAKPLLAKFDLWADTSPDLLLCALYYREFVNKEAFSNRSSVVVPEKHGQVPTNDPSTTDNPADADNPSMAGTLVTATAEAVAVPPVLNAVVVESELNTPGD
ncbi:MAG: RDD family protein [Pirellula sp.]